MTVTYLGTMTVGETIPGVSVVLHQLQGAVAAMQAACSAAAADLADIQERLNAQVSALASAKVAIRVPAVADFQARLDACVAMQAGLTSQLTDPVTYIQALIAGAVQAQANVAALAPPSLALTGQIAAQVALEAGLSSSIGAVDLQLGLLDAVGAALTAIVALAGRLAASLLGALSGALSGLIAYAELSPSIAAAGAKVFSVDALAQDVSAQLSAVLPGAGLGAGVRVRGPIILGDTAGAAPEGMAAVFRIA